MTITILVENIDSSQTTNDDFRQILFYEIWEPNRSHEIKRIFQKRAVNHDSWNIGPTYERFLQEEKKNPQTAVSLKWYSNGPTIPLVDFSQRLYSSSHPLSSHDVICMIRTYSIEKRISGHHHPLAFQAVQHLADTALFVGDIVGKSNNDVVVIHSTCNAEKKYLNESIIHEKFTIRVLVSSSPPPPLLLSSLQGIGNHKKAVDYWRQKLYFIWHQFIKFELECSDVKTRACATVCVEGAGELNPLAENDLCYDAFAGLSLQSQWYLFPEEKVFDQEWFLEAFDQSIGVKGLNFQDFDKFSSSNSSVDLLTYQTAIVRACTLLQTTHPYVGDYRFSSSWKRVSADMFNPKFRTVLGDCEDGAMASYFIFYHLIRTENWTDKRMQYIRKIAVMMGIPVGIIGRGRDPNVKPGTGKDVCHMFAAIVPFPILFEALKGRVPTPSELQYVRRQFDIPDFLQFNTQSAVIETTIMTTSFYHKRDVDTKAKAREEIVKVLTTLGQDDKLMWKNYTTQHPLSYTRGDAVGEIVHTQVNRLFTAPFQLFVENPSKFVLNKKKEINLLTQQSFVVKDNNVVGVSANVFFAPKSEQKKWSLEPSAIMSQQVFDTELEVLRAFKRPIVPLMQGHFDPLRLKDNNETSEMEEILMQRYPTKQQGGDHIFVYAWRLFKDSNDKVEDIIKRKGRVPTSVVIEEIKRRIQAKWVSMHYYGNGYAFVFHL